MTTNTLRSPAMRAISQILVVSMLFSTTVTATWGIRGMPLPQPVTALASEAPIDWLASTTLPALPEVDSGDGGTLLQLNADLLASDGLAVPTVQPRLVAPAFLKGPSLDYIVASAPSMAGETSYMFESGATDSRSWQIPAGALQQGGTYYWKVIDLTNNNSNEWASFSVDIHRAGVQPVDALGPLSVSLASGELTTAAGTIGVPTVAGQLQLSLAYSSARHETTFISEGWSLAGLSILGYTQASYSANQDAITLTTVDGGTLTFVQPGPNGPWQASPQNGVPAGLAGSLTVSAQGDIIYTAVAGSVSVFNAQGQLQSVTVAGSGADAQWQLQWSGDRLTRITDPVSQRSALFYYTHPGNYQPAEGFDWLTPAGKLTRFINLDGRMTTLFYNDAGQLARLEQSGGKVVDFAYDVAGRLAQVRTPEGADLDAHNGIRAERRYSVDYLTDGRVRAITGPAPLSGQARLSHHYTYGDGQTTVTEQLAGQAIPLQTVSYDDRWRSVSETELLTGYTINYTWVADEDRITAVVDSDGLKRTAHFDAYGRISAMYGPAPEDQFDNQGLPTDASVPASYTVYDTGVDPLVVRAWDQPDFSGAPVAIGTQTTAFDLSTLAGFSTSSEGWSAIVSTVITIPSSGELHLRAAVANNAAVDVTLVASGADIVDATTITVADASAGDVLPVTLLLAGSSSNASGQLQLFSSKSGEENTWQAIKANTLSAGLGLTTEQIGTEQLSSQQGLSILRSTRTYQNPVQGNPLSQTLDPGGLGLTTQLQYGNELYGRVTGQSLPSGMSTTFTYWAGGTAACAGAYTQSGNLASTTLPHASQANTAGRTTTLFYNASGQQVGVQVDNNPASCLSYDDRGRVVSLDIPATDEAPGKQLQMSYGLDGELFSTTQTSIVGETESTVQVKADLLGRAIESTDEWGTVVSTEHDDVNRQLTTTTVVTDAWGQQHQTVMVSSFDEAGRPLTLTRNGVSLIDQITYWDDGALIDYGNGSSVATALNAYQQLYQQMLILPDNSVVTDTLTLSPSGRILGEFIIGATGDTAEYAYTFDQALRLSQASLTGSHPALGVQGYQWHYGFGDGGGLNPQAGKDGAVTEETVTSPDGQTEFKIFSYNYVDGLTGVDSSDQANTMTVAYDAAGYNMTRLTQGNGNTLFLSYDQSDQLIAASDSAGKSVTYTRSADNRVLAKVTRQIDPDSGEETTATVLYSGGWALNEQRQPMSQTIALPGGVMLSIAADASEQRWYYSSLQNHTLLTINGLGEQQGELALYSPYGEVLTAHPDTLEGAPQMGFDGASGVETETFAIDMALMGDRVYIPAIHSFTTLDPSFNGGTSPYNYANADPVNLSDPSGNAPESRFWKGEFWDADNPYMWALVAGIVIGVAFGVGSGFAMGLFLAIGVGGLVGFVILFSYGMITTGGDAGASARMGLIGAAYGAAGGAMGFVAAYGLRTAINNKMNSPKINSDGSIRNTLPSWMPKLGNNSSSWTPLFREQPGSSSYIVTH